MNNDMLDLCAWTIEEAKRAGADDCRVKVNRSRSVSSYRQRKPETVKESHRAVARAARLCVGVFPLGDGRLAQDTLRQLP